MTRRTSSTRAVTRAVPSLSRYSLRFTIGSLPSQNRLTRSRVVTWGRGWVSSVAISPRGDVDLLLQREADRPARLGLRLLRGRLKASMLLTRLFLPEG